MNINVKVNNYKPYLLQSFLRLISQQNNVIISHIKTESITICDIPQLIKMIKERYPISKILATTFNDVIIEFESYPHTLLIIGLTDEQIHIILQQVNYINNNLPIVKLLEEIKWEEDDKELIINMKIEQNKEYSVEDFIGCYKSKIYGYYDAIKDVIIFNINMDDDKFIKYIGEQIEQARKVVDILKMNISYDSLFKFEIKSNIVITTFYDLKDYDKDLNKIDLIITAQDYQFGLNDINNIQKFINEELLYF